ncbi:class I SAM-dependent methyltransferase [Streptomyces sp. NPDC001700]
MALNYNDHYHPLLLKQIPAGARTALDVGCGTGRFARLLAARGLSVDGMDPNAAVIESARATGGGPRYRQADVREAHLPDAHYDVISCIASLHHMPFDTVLTLRKALAPGGILTVLGLYEINSPADFVWAFPAKSLLHAQRLLPRRHRPTPPVQIPLVWPPPLTYAQTRTETTRLLPGATLRRLLFWRYLLVYRG